MKITWRDLPAREDRPGPQIDFIHATSRRSSKVQCSVCGREGYGPAVQDADARDTLRWDYAPWQILCLRGHIPAACCGAMATPRLDGTPRRHPRCSR